MPRKLSRCRQGGVQNTSRGLRPGAKGIGGSQPVRLADLGRTLELARYLAGGQVVAFAEMNRNGDIFALEWIIRTLRRGCAWGAGVDPEAELTDAAQFMMLTHSLI
jgi:hypothetical protein